MIDALHPARSAEGPAGRAPAARRGDRARAGPPRSTGWQLGLDGGPAERHCPGWATRRGGMGLRWLVPAALVPWLLAACAGLRPVSAPFVEAEHERCTREGDGALAGRFLL